MTGTSKAVMRRLGDSRYATRYFIGHGLDIGAGKDPLSQFGEFFPLMKSCRDWDRADGDAQFLHGVADNSLDFVHSSHCLEHMNDPAEALQHWLRVLKPGGHLVVLVPDEDMYEQGIFPSTWNTDHKWTFTTCKAESWCDRSINLMELLPRYRNNSYVVKLELMDAGFRFMTGGRFDQTRTIPAECGIEFIVRKIG
jgi:SAM-dependent methyltransferase